MGRGCSDKGSKLLFEDHCETFQSKAKVNYFCFFGEISYQELTMLISDELSSDGISKRFWDPDFSSEMRLLLFPLLLART